MAKYDYDVILNFSKERELLSAPLLKSTKHAERLQAGRRKKPGIVAYENIHIISPDIQCSPWLDATTPECQVLSKLTHHSRLTIILHGAVAEDSRHDGLLGASQRGPYIKIDALAEFIFKHCSQLRCTDSSLPRKIKISLLSCEGGKGRGDNLTNSNGYLLNSCLWHRYQIPSIISARVESIYSLTKKVEGYEDNKNRSKINFTQHQNTDVFYYEYDDNLRSFYQHVADDMLVDASFNFKLISERERDYLIVIIQELRSLIKQAISTSAISTIPLYLVEANSVAAVIGGQQLHYLEVINPIDFPRLKHSMLQLLRTAALELTVLYEDTNPQSSWWRKRVPPSRQVVDKLIQQIERFER